MPNKKKAKAKGKDEKAINLVRFAYDICRYSALKFKVPSQSIPVWEGPENDYKCSDFFSAVSRLVIVHQINMRCQLNPTFKGNFEPRLRNSLEHTRELLRKVIERITGDNTLGIIINVELSLATMCEFILFLYSENSDLCLVQLAEVWFHCYFKPNRAKFRRKGGFDEIYRKGQEMQKDVPDALVDEFIVAFCTNYQNSAQANLEEMYFDMVREYKQKNYEKYCTGESEEPDKDLPLKTYLFVELPLTSVQDSGLNLPPNPLLGVTAPSDMYNFPLGGDAPLSENLPEKSVQALSKRTKRPSYRDRRRSRMLSSSSSGEQSFGPSSSDSSLATATALSYESQGARPKDRAPYGEPSGLQTGDSGLCSSSEQSLGQWSLDSSGAERCVQKYLSPSDKLLESPIPLNFTIRDLDKSVSNLVLSGNQDIEELSLDSLVLKESSEKKSDISAADDLTSQNNPDEVPQEPTQEHSGSSSEQETEIEIREE